MTRLVWGQAPANYDHGVDRGVLYLPTGAVPWSGLVSVEESEPGATETTHYFDGVGSHISTQAHANFEGVVNAFMYPREFDEYDGYSPKVRNDPLGFSYRTLHGDSYRTHLVYKTKFRASFRSWQTMGTQPLPSVFVWDISSDTVEVPGARDTSHLVLDAEQLSWVSQVVEDYLYGTETTEPRLPTPQELVELYESATSLKVTLHPDGSYTVDGPDAYVRLQADGEFVIDSPSALIVSPHRFQVSSF